MGLMVKNVFKNPDAEALRENVNRCLSKVIQHQEEKSPPQPGQKDTGTLPTKPDMIY